MWIDRPWLCAKRHRIEMAGKSDRQLSRNAADTGDDLRAAVTEWNDIDREACIFQQSSKRFGTGPLGTRRIDGVEANKVLRQLD
jgi:hypothetical protein